MGGEQDFLQSGSARFHPGETYLHLPAEGDDPEGLCALHELLHAQTLAGSRFYAAYASRVLAGSPLRLTDFAAFLEIVPERVHLRHQRSTIGTNPNVSTLRAIDAVISIYREKYWQYWKGTLKLGPAAIKAEIDPVNLFDRSVLIAIVRTALDLAVVRGDGTSPDDHVLSLERRLQHENVAGPLIGYGIEHHIETLMGRPQTNIISMFEDQINLAHALESADKERMLRFRPLLTAVTRAYYFSIRQGNHLWTSFFADDTEDGAKQMIDYVDSKPIPNDVKEKLAGALMSVERIPRHRGLPIVIDQDEQADAEVVGVYEMLRLRHYISTLPNFVEGLLRTAPFNVDMKHIEDLRDSSEDAFEAHAIELGRVSGCTDVKRYAQLSRRVHFVGGLYNEKQVFMIKLA